MSYTLDGKVAVVTGGGRGIGRAEALQLAAAGASVVVNDLGVALDGSRADDTPARLVSSEIRDAGGVALPHYGDVGTWGDSADLIRTAIEKFGRLDIVVNNAGILTPTRAVPDIDIEEFDATFHAHVRGHFCMTIAATRHWRDEVRRLGSPVAARIINTASAAYLFGSPWRVDYAAAKAAIVALTMGTAQSCHQFGVRTNAVCPRASTRMGEKDLGPLGKDGHDPNSPDNIAPLIVALSGPQGGSVNGQVFVAYNQTIELLQGPSLAMTFESSSAWTAEGVANQLAAYFSTDRSAYAQPVPDSAKGMLNEIGVR